MDEKVMIGDYIGTIEEFMPGSGTFEEEGKVYAAKVGVKSVDVKKHVAEVKGKDIPSLDIDQTVFGEVVMMKQSQAIVNVTKIKGYDTPVDYRTMIYIKNIDDKFVKNITDMFAVGDIVKAKVLRIEGDNIDLTTKEPELGVVKAFGKETRLPLELSEKQKDRLQDPKTKRLETRKISSEYGRVNEI